MYNMNNVIKNSIVTVCGNVNDENSLLKLQYVTENNSEFYKAANDVIFIFNCNLGFENNLFEFKTYIEELGYKFVYVQRNKGWQFGHIDLDKVGLKYAKVNGYDFEYLIKVSGDVLIDWNVLSKRKIEKVDFIFYPYANYTYCLHNIMPINDYEIYCQSNEFIKQLSLGNPLFGPQTLFYCLRLSKFDDIYEKDEVLEEKYMEWKKTEYLQQYKFICAEHSLLRGMKNNITCGSLFTVKEFCKLCRFTKINNITDGALKNVFLKNIGLLHFHKQNEPVLLFSS